MAYVVPCAYDAYVQTRPIRRIEHWGKVDVEYLDISLTDGKKWRESLSTEPAVIVAIDVNVHAKANWQNGWPRPLGICQWTLSGAPYHPIFIDATRRVVNSTRVVADWDMQRKLEIHRLERQKPEGWEDEIKHLRGKSRSEVMNVMEWTGPGLFSDSVLA